MTTLLIAEHDNNSISDSVRKAITAAHEIGAVSYTHLTLPTNREV